MLPALTCSTKTLLRNENAKTWRRSVFGEILDLVAGRVDQGYCAGSATMPSSTTPYPSAAEIDHYRTRPRYSDKFKQHVYETSDAHVGPLRTSLAVKIA